MSCDTHLFSELPPGPDMLLCPCLLNGLMLLMPCVMLGLSGL